MKKTETAPEYWQSLADRAGSPDVDLQMHDEFTEAVEGQPMDGSTRRHFMGVMGAATAMASLQGCFLRRPKEHIMPFSQAPEDMLPGVAQHYATATSIGGNAIGLLVESSDGRPTKIEGNPDHPSSLGGTTAIHQGMVLDLYDPSRLKTPLKNRVPVSWAAVDDFIAAHFKPLQDKGGVGMAIVSAAMVSPTYDMLKARISAAFPAALWSVYEPIDDDNARTGLQAAFGKSLRVSPRLAKAHTVLSLDADFLGDDGDVVANTAAWASTRAIEKSTDEISRLYSVEGRYTITGSNADHRLRIAPSQVEKVAWGIASALHDQGRGIPQDIVSSLADKTATLTTKQKSFINAAVGDLLRQKNGMAGLVLAGRSQPASVHAVTAAINHALGAHGTTLYYFQDNRRADDGPGSVEGLGMVTQALNADTIDTLLIIGGNPVYSAPGDINFAAGMKKAKTVICLADYPDETSKLAHWAIPRTHFLEAWGDIAYTDGTVAIQQPLIAPLHGAWSEIEVLAKVLREPETDGHSLVRNNWRSSEGKFDFHKKWRRWLHDGRMSKPAFGAFAAYKAPRGLGLLGGAPLAAAPTPERMELVFSAGAQTFDGRFANNAWLQEAPDPITKVCWDNPVHLSPATAKRLGIEDEDRVKVILGDKSVDAAAWILPGLADDVVHVTLGYGRNFDNFLPYHDRGVVGFDFNPLRTAKQRFIVQGVEVNRGTSKYPIACVQRYSRQTPGFGYEARPLVREATTAGYKADPTFAKAGIIEHGEPFPKALVAHPPEKSIYPDWDYSKGMQWGLAIDLNRCTGCNACLVACVSENNIMSVGKDQVRRGREMHWIRMDRYFTGSEDEPQIVHQPMTCQQCETAPCENVCPVAATTHSPEGLNDMAYNRCIGTRYCANNCPFKVRRFNFYNYSKDQDETVHMVRNPNVTVRFRGVIEKCTYCVQRINMGKRTAKLSGDADTAKKIVRGITTACAQACPAGAIVFGDINDKGSRVAELKARDRDYRLLTELNLKPRTSYLAKIRNPNPKLGA